MSHDWFFTYSMLLMQYSNAIITQIIFLHLVRLVEYDKRRSKLTIKSFKVEKIEVTTKKQNAKQVTSANETEIKKKNMKVRKNCEKIK